MAKASKNGFMQTEITDHTPKIQSLVSLRKGMACLQDSKYSFFDAKFVKLPFME
jgi:histidinol phosphatase-like PHP family hydrolase